MYFSDKHKNTNIDQEFKKQDKKKINFKYIIISGIILLILILLIILLPKMFHKEYFLVLNGDTDIIVKQNSIYEEAGFKATDNKGNDLSNQVEITGQVNTAVAGEYIITYTLEDKVITRTVLVVAEENQVTYLILSGSATIFLKVGEQYTEPGYTVIDNLEDNLTNKVTVSGDVNTNASGTYKLIYTVTNKSGETVREERTIIVMDSDINLNYTPTSATNGEVTINVSISDNYFDYLLLPDNTKITTRSATYKVNKNGTYKFTIYSKDGSYKYQEVTINNIDKEVPSGSCSGYYKKGISYITVNAKDNSGILKYVINNQTFNSKQITYNQELATATVNVYDKANNQATIKCNLKNENTIYPAFFGVKNYTYSTGANTSYWLYIPEKATDNMPMIVFLHGSGEAGNDFYNNRTKAITWGPGRDIKQKNAKFNAIILMPQAMSDWSSATVDNVKNLIDKIANDYQVDKQRISISGFSLGCMAIPKFLKKFPNYFSAAVPIECNDHSSIEYAKLYVNSATWTFASQGYTDSALKKLTNNIKSLGGTAQHSYYPNLGHTGLVGNRNYSIFMDEKLDLVNWMTSHVRK